MLKKYEAYLKVDKEYQPVPGVSLCTKLSPGVYRVDWDQRSDTVSFAEMDSCHDKLVDLPGTEYDLVMSDMDTFLSKECIARFEEIGLIHKMNILLYGSPGTGKTCIVNRVSQKVIDSGGIVLFNPSPGSLKTTYEVLDAIQPETRVLVIFEEMDEHVRNDETKLLHVLDGEVQKRNAMYIATTNYIDKIPARVRRPGRFASVIKVGFPSAQARKAYLSTKLKDPALISEIASKTEGFSIDELKEVVRGHYCMMKPLDEYIQLIRESSSKTKKEQYDEDDAYNEWHEEKEMVGDLAYALKRFVNKNR